MNITLTSLSRAHPLSVRYHGLTYPITKYPTHAKRAHTATTSSEAKYIGDACIACTRTRFTESENVCCLECAQFLCLGCLTQHIDSSAGMYSPPVCSCHIPPPTYTDRQIKELKSCSRYGGVLNLWKKCRRRRRRYCHTGLVSIIRWEC